MVNSDMLRGNWMQIRGSVKQMWGKLTDDDLTQIDGNKDKLVGKLQERYGYSKEKAEQEVNHFMNQEGSTRSDFGSSHLH
jgi:uncharacterized protein YjbJ (UPF0337 family)